MKKRILPRIVELPPWLLEGKHRRPRAHGARRAALRRRQRLYAAFMSEHEHATLYWPFRSGRKYAYLGDYMRMNARVARPPAPPIKSKRPKTKRRSRVGRNVRYKGPRD